MKTKIRPTKININKSTEKSNQVLYFEFSILQHSPEVEPAGPLQHVDEPDPVAQVVSRPAHALIVLAVVRALGTRVDVHLRGWRHEHYKTNDGRGDNRPNIPGQSIYDHDSS